MQEAKARRRTHIGLRRESTTIGIYGKFWGFLPLGHDLRRVCEVEFCAHMKLLAIPIECGGRTKRVKRISCVKRVCSSVG